MDDINFEELDKAVNSALQQTGPKPTSEEEPVSSVEQSDTQETDDQSVDAMPAQASQPAVSRRRGQFMDMVHPSSDMIKQSGASSSRPSRQAATLQPLDPTIVETSSKLAEPEVAPGEVTATAAEQEKPRVEFESQAASEWPDPIDVMEKTESEQLDEQESLGNDEDAIAARDVYEPEHIEEDGFPEPAISPFINGADLEKRPLGAFADNAPVTKEDEDRKKDVESLEVEEREDVDVASDETVQELPAEIPTPQELTPEVVSVESDDPARTSQELTSVDTEANSDSGTSPGDATGMAASISQQYKNPEVAVEDEGGHPVFDTKDYHQPLTPPARKSHTAVITILVIIMLALLAAAAWYAIAVLKLI